jgi:hypothetical protein
MPMRSLSEKMENFSGTAIKYNFCHIENKEEREEGTRICKMDEI